MSSHGETSVLVENATARLKRWLCEGPAVMRSGPQAGAVIGNLARDGTADYAYPEIAGYCLTWLSFLHRSGETTAFHHDLANCVVDWVVRWADAGMQTRVYLQRHAADDWRNNAIFLFDIAMLLRGVNHAKESGLAGSANCQDASWRLIRQIGAMRDPAGGLRCLTTLRGGEVPDRWSTRMGPFLLKALVSLIRLGNADALFQPLRTAAQATLRNVWPDNCGSVHPDCDHAAMYFVEGVLLARESGIELPNAEASCREILNRNMAALGADMRRWSGRHDVLAQWLRSALLVIPSRKDATFMEVTRGAARHLALSVTADGGLPFERVGDDSAPNTWCAMFAHQALWVFSNPQKERSEPWARRFLV
jgi:hypothetical protein